MGQQQERNYGQPVNFGEAGIWDAGDGSYLYKMPANQMYAYQHQQMPNQFRSDVGGGLAQMNDIYARNAYYGNERYKAKQPTLQAQINANASNYASDNALTGSKYRDDSQVKQKGLGVNALTSILGSFAGMGTPGFKFSYGEPNPQGNPRPTDTTLPAMMRGLA